MSDTIDAYELIRGVSPVLATPFGPEGAVDSHSFRHSLDTLVGAGVTSVMFPGIASEFHALDDAEKGELLRETVAVAVGARLAVVGSVSDNSTVVACRRARELVELGVHAINVFPPRFLPMPASVILDHIHHVLATVPEVPVILQYVPDGGSTQLTPDDIRVLASDHSNFRVVKAELRNPADYIADLLVGTPAVRSLVGNGGIELLPALEAGAIGVQPGGGFVEIYITIWDLWASGRRAAAEDLFRRLLPYLNAWISAGVLTEVGKIIAYRRGEIATPICRRPLVPIGSYASSLIDRFLAEFAEELVRGCDPR